MPAADLAQAHTDSNASPTDLTRESLSGIDVSRRSVSVVIEDTPVHAFVDTGADVSVISQDFRMSPTALHKKPIVKQFLPLTSVTVTLWTQLVQFKYCPQANDTCSSSCQKVY